MKLSKVTDGSAVWSIPITPRLAGTLVDLLLSSPEDREQAVVVALRLHPEFALWALLRWRHLQQVTSLKALAEVLSQNFFDCIVQFDLDSAPTASAAAWDTLLEQTLLAANDAPSDRGTLVRLLYRAEEWLEACGPQVTASSALLPAWFLTAREELPQAKLPTGGAPSRQVLLTAEDASRNYHMLASLAPKLARLENLQTQFSILLEQEKLKSMKELAYGASHEINNPLANISTRAQTLIRDEEDPQRRKKLAAINSQAFRAHEMISNMMHYAKPPDLHREEVNLAGLIKTVLNELQLDAELQETKLRKEITDGPIIIQVDPTHFAKSLKALVINALEALVRGGEVLVTAGRSSASTGEKGALITVSDTGPGIPAEVRPHIFDPFYSGREAGRGLGFGLSKCWQVVRHHGGNMTVDSTSNGARFCIWLPQDSPVPEQVS